MDKVAREREIARRNAYQSTFGTVDGRWVIEDLERIFGHQNMEVVVHNSPNAALALAHDAGRKDVLAHLKDSQNPLYDDESLEPVFYNSEEGEQYE